MSKIAEVKTKEELAGMYSKATKKDAKGNVCLTDKGVEVPLICHCGSNVLLKNGAYVCKHGHEFGKAAK